MKYLLTMVLSAVLLLSGCMSEGEADGLHSFDSSALQEEVSDAPYQPKLPTELPYEVVKTDFTGALGDQTEDVVLDFRFIGESDQQVLELMTFNGNDIEQRFETEPIDHADFTGEYGEQQMENGETVKLIMWKDEEVVYELTTAGEVSKDKLIRVASSFE
ncbi:DUF4367 domain-containing protein [Halobacillus litoralis]|uniref:DUF4367 domain-containing protein n=1 Tax=Halobacillus litoralis TaxID=45668 RepID=UPI001CD454B0|nr:DUF4367 domain-containing protein [Halobacillus litoralis]MCA0970812.1 DUF4367 domain-containing protein [Halobacillus litoralis]